MATSKRVAKKSIESAEKSESHEGSEERCRKCPGPGSPDTLVNKLIMPGVPD